MSLSNRDVIRKANEMATLMSELCVALEHGTLSRMSEYSEGVRAASLAPSTAHGSYSDPTAAAAIGRRRDAAAIHRVEMERNVLRALAAVRRALDIAQLYPEPGPSAAAELAALERSTEPGCESCSRTFVAQGVRRWEPPDSRLSNRTVAGGVLSEALWLCYWCNRQTRLWGRLPSVDELERHHRGERVTWPADVERKQA